MWGEATIDRHRHPAANDSQALGCHHRFAGQYYDEESELHYNRFRYYSPKTGQYLSHDPIGLLGGFNPYGYVFDPTGWVDVLGLKPKIPPFDAPSLESDVVRYKPRDVLTATAGSREDAINLAWSQEKQLIQQTGRGTRPWTPEEMALITSTPDSELLSVMSKEGWIYWTSYY
ncbi:RHS repeat-associated core domain-containing protein [Bisgaard Taxon 46]